MGKMPREPVSDVRSCISAIGGYAKRLNGNKLTESQRQDYVRRIINSVSESQAILNQLERNTATFLGMVATTIDYKWRLVLPCNVAKHFYNRLLFVGGKDCLEIHKPATLIFKEDAPFASIQRIKIQRIKNGNDRQIKKSVVIPGYLRDSYSFCFGKRVILAGRGDFLEIWPWYQ